MRQSKKLEAYAEERAKDPRASNTDIARRAGYKGKHINRRAYEAEHDERVQARLSGLLDVGLDTLEDVAKHDKNGIARAAAAKTLVEAKLGKPKDNKQSTFGDITINVAKLDETALKALTLPTNV